MSAHPVLDVLWDVRPIQAPTSPLSSTSRAQTHQADRRSRHHDRSRHQDHDRDRGAGDGAGAGARPGRPGVPGMVP